MPDTKTGFIMNYDLVAYCSASYKDVLKFSLSNWIASDAHRIYIFSDDMLDIPYNKKVIVRPDFVPSRSPGVNFMRKAVALEKIIHECNMNTILLDVDCLITKPLKNIFKNKFDVAATVRQPCVSTPNRPFKTVSAGALFCQRTRATRQFVNEWYGYQRDSTNKIMDERGLAVLLGRHFKGKTMDLLSLSCVGYNSFPYQNSALEITKWLKSITTKTRILHFALGTWKNKSLVEKAISLTKSS
jgi:hypothetical protein